MGSSADWQRERFTMDEGCSKAVEEVFVKLYNEGYIYKGNRIINWCPVCQTSISDAEVEHVEQKGHFWHMKYPVVGEEGRFVQFATTRPETMLGDTALAVNPADDRYKDIVGKDWFMALLDLRAYIDAKERVLCDYENRFAWAGKMLVNTAKAGFFSSDRTIAQYNADIWKL